MYCGKCGAEIADRAEKCAACGEPVPRADREASFDNAARRYSPKRVIYAGFWLRAVAFLTDSIILGFLTLPVVLRPILNNLGTEPTAKSYLDFVTGSSRQAVALELLMNLILVLYCAAFESSAWQATPGKKLLHIYVTDRTGNRVSFARAIGRNVGKVLEPYTLAIGFLMAGFTAKKQALHDLVAGCLLLKKKERPRSAQTPQP